MRFDTEAKVALDPQLCLRHDVDRAVIITRPAPLAGRNHIRYLMHPCEAVVLALMDGSRTVKEVGYLWADLTGKSPEAGLQEVSNLAEAYSDGVHGRGDFLIEVDEDNAGSIRKYEPMDFIVRADQVNLVDNRLRIPYVVYFLPTLYCPQKCIYCYARTRPHLESEPISLERLRAIFAELSGLGVETLQLSGGDPFAHPQILSILEAIFEAGMTPDIPTKLGLTYAMARRLKSLGLSILQVSLDSSEPAVLDRMVGVEGYHRRAFRALNSLKQAGFTVRVNCVLTPLNVVTIGSLIDYLGKLGNVVQVTLTPYGRSLFCHRDELFVGAAELDLARTAVATRLAAYPHMKVNLGGAFEEPKSEEDRLAQWQERAFCTANRDGFVILPDGRVTVCEELYDHPAFVIGDLRRQSVMEMWSSPEALALANPEQSAVPDGPCSTCEAFVACNTGRGRCWRDVLKSYGWDRPHYPDPRCPLAPTGNRLG